ncbi:MAG: peptidoglycan editing factor PgeF [Pikeienuella sp.]
MATPIRSDYLDANHGFFSRRGGVSTGIYEGLNCGAGSSDDPTAMAENRARVAAAMGVETVVSLHQVHSPTVVHVTAPMAEKPKADAMVTATPGIGLGVLSADCAPVLFSSPEGIVGAAHAGWKGAIGGVTDATITAMQALGASAITAAIGPCISQRAYEVGPEFMDNFLDDDPENDRFFAGGAGDRVQFDLPGYLLNRLRAAGATASWTGHCTFSDPVQFFSYRRTCHAGEPDYGRHVSVITSKEA